MSTSTKLEISKAASSVTHIPKVRYGKNVELRPIPKLRPIPNINERQNIEKR